MSSSSYVPKIILFSGSKRTGSINQSLVNAMAHLFKEAGAKPVKISLAHYDMPIFCEDWESENGVPKTTKSLVRKLKNADGVFIASPEYNGCMPALLKNTIDWSSRIGSDHFKMPVYGIGSATPGSLSGIMVLRQLHFILCRLGATVVNAHLGAGGANALFDKKGRFVEGRTKQLAQTLVSQMMDEIARRQ